MANFKATIRRHSSESSICKIIEHKFIENHFNKYNSIDDCISYIDHWNENTDVFWYEVIKIEEI